MKIAFILSIVNVFLLFALTMNHLLRGLDDWWLIALFLVPAWGMIWAIDRIE